MGHVQKEDRKPCLTLQTKNYGNTTPHGPAARGKTHKGGNTKGTCTLGNMSISQQTTGQPATGHFPNEEEDITDRPPGVTSHESLATSQMRIIQDFSIQSMTGHRPSNHLSLDLENLNTEEFSIPRPPVIRLYQPIVIGTSAIGMEFTNNQPSSKRVLLPLEPDFSNMSDDSDASRPRWLSWMCHPTGDQEVAGSTPAKVGNILSWRLIMKYFVRSFSPFH